MKRLSLIQKYLILSIISLILFGLAFGKIVSTRLEQNMISRAKGITASFLVREAPLVLSSEDMKASGPGFDYDDLSRRIREHLFVLDFKKIKVWNKDYVVVWSDDRASVGQRFPDNTELKESLAGEVVAEIISEGHLREKYNHAATSESVMELYVPFRRESNGEVEGVIEVYESLSQLYEEIARNNRVIWFSTVSGMTILFFLLFGIVKKASQTIESQNEEIRHAKEEWEEAFNTITDAITIHDIDFNIIRSNKAAKELLGLPALTMTRQKCYEAYHGTGCPPEGCPSCLTLKSRRVTEAEMFEPHLNKHIELKALPRFDATGKLTGLIHVVRDITGRRRSEEALLASERKYRELVENANSIILRWNREGLITFMNEFGQKFFGYAEAEILGRYVVGTIVPETESTGRSLRPLMNEICADPKKFENNINENIRHNGERVWIAWTNKVILDGLGSVSEILSIGSDITDRKRAEEALLEEQGFSASLIRNSGSASFVLDKTHKIMLWNKACEELTGYRDAEMIGTDNQWKPFYHEKRPTVADIIIDNNLDGLPALYKSYTMSALNSQAIRAEGWYKNLGGKDRYIVFEAAPIHNTKGDLIAAIETLQDITESKRLEDQLLHSQKIEAIGQLAGGVAHDFNNILSAIMGYTHLTITNLPKDDPLRGHLEQVLQASDRATTLTQSLLSFSRKQVMNPKAVNLNDIVKRQEKFLLRLIREDIEITITCAEEELTIYADSGQIEQVLMNLVTNARDAMPGGGRIMIRTEAMRMQEGFIEAHGYGKVGKYARILISDSGQGMDATTKERIFEPFFTTKDQGKGTGLGLSMVYGIVMQHDGFIDVYSEAGEGTTFKIYLPLIRGTAEEDQGEIEFAAVQGGSETILVAEDDASLRTLSATILCNYGYSVIEAVDGEDAVKKYRQNRDRVQLLILDGIMPKKNGKEAYHEIRIMNPTIKALFVSGYAEDIINKQCLLDPGINFILKPLTPSQLLKKVREVLDT